MTIKGPDNESTELKTMKLMRDSEGKEPRTKKSGLHHSLTIDARFGSEMQRTVAIRLLDQFLAAWKEASESHHKKNSIRIIRGNETTSPSANERQGR
jgi:hypothetical protein